MSTHHESERERPELTALLAAATAPGDERELAGEQNARWQFRTAHLAASAPARRQRSRRVLKTAVANALAAKLALASAAAVAAGGVVFAAESGGWQAAPVYLVAPPHASAIAHQPGGSSDAAEPSEPAEPIDATESNAPPTPGEPAESDASKASPTPSLTGLCKAFQAGATSNPGKALVNPAFSVLVSAAAGADNVAAYCTTLVGPANTRPSHTTPTHPGQARGLSKGAPGTRGRGHRHGHGLTHPKTRLHGRWANSSRGTPMRS